MKGKMMDLLPLAMIQSQNSLRSELYSALPNAPVVPEPVARPHRPRAVRTRTSLAHLLERSARRIAPTPTCTPLH
jgi:hypothetical protein